MENKMEIELHCPGCPCRFAAAPTRPYGEVLDQMMDEGPWYALAEGETFEDMIFSALLTRGAIHCPECGKPIHVREQSIGRLTDQLAAEHRDRPVRPPQRRLPDSAI
jgi:hypothetical protein